MGRNADEKQEQTGRGLEWHLRSERSNVARHDRPADRACPRARPLAGRGGGAGVRSPPRGGGGRRVDRASRTPRPAGPVDGETLFTAFSVTKAVTATALHLQAERGLVDYATPVADYWPAFAANGKQQITVGQVLAHRSGIPQMPPGIGPEQMCDWDWMIAEIERFEPMFAPGTTNAYHKLVFGWVDRRDRAAHRSRPPTVRCLRARGTARPARDHRPVSGRSRHVDLGRVAVVVSDAPPAAQPRPHGRSRRCPSPSTPGPSSTAATSASRSGPEVAGS